MQVHSHPTILRELARDRSSNFSLINEPHTVQNTALEITESQVVIPKDADAFIPLYISSNTPLEHLEVTMAGTTIFSFPLEFCNKISKKIKKIKNNFPTNEFLYEIPWDLVYKHPIYLVSMAFIETVFKFKSQTPCNGTLYGSFINLETQSRRILCQTHRKYIITQIVSQELNLHRIGENTYDIILNGICKGFVLENIDINKINGIKISLDDSILLSYDKNMIHFFLQKLSKNCYYLSFGNNDFFDSINYNQSINLTRFERFTLTICSQKIQKINLHFLCANVLVTKNGLSGLHFGGVTLTILKSASKPLSGSIGSQRKPLEGDPQCSISLEDIKIDDEYMTCSTCKKNFFKDKLTTWFSSRPVKICPHCRSRWYHTTIYVNIEK